MSTQNKERTGGFAYLDLLRYEEGLGSPDLLLYEEELGYQDFIRDEGELDYPDLIQDERTLGVEIPEAVIAADALQEVLYDRRNRPVQPISLRRLFS